MRVLVTFVTVVLGSLVLAGFLGAMHPAGDSFAVFRMPLLIIFALFVIWSHWPKLLRWPLAVLALVAMAQIALPRLTSPASPSDYDWKIHQQNLRFNRVNDQEWLDLIDANAPDFITLQEVSGRNKSVLGTLASDFPYQNFCEFAAVGGVAVLSKLEPVPETKLCAEGDGLAAMQVRTDHGPVWLVSIHLHWPWPYGQAAQVDRLIPLIQRLDGHVIMAGDFNSVPWSYTVKRMQNAIGGGTVFNGQKTFDLPFLGMPVTIDHVLSGSAYAQAARSMPKAGSDHHGVLAHLTRPRAP